MLFFLAALVFLSSLLPAGPLGFGGIQLAFYLTAILWEKEILIGYSIYYNFYIFLPAVVIAAILFTQKKQKKR